MGLREEFEATGNWLFRRRGYLPLLLFPLLLVAARESTYPAGSHGLDLAWEAVCLLLALIGLGLRIGTVGFVPRDTSGRNTGGQLAGSLNTSGFYSVVRHPLYLGNYLMWLGVALFARSWWAPVIVSLVFWLYYERIMFAEEEFLRGKFGEEYERWAEKTPAFMPRLRGWVAPVLPFSWRNVAKREYSGLFAVALIFPVMNTLANYQAARLPRPDHWQTALLVSGFVTYAVLRTLKRNTRLLHLEGR
jgi:protein-S-isoprenylcysteine O-methyltransferase Ste14